jgi:hypothetical protein
VTLLFLFNDTESSFYISIEFELYVLCIIAFVY